MTLQTGPRQGRRRSTTRGHIADVAIDLFAARGFDAVNVDDVAQAAGIARRTLFRYYASKNAIPWGDFDAHLNDLRDLLNGVDQEVSLRDALRGALLAFNTYSPAEAARHRERMRVILETAELQAYSMTMYAGWREVIAEFVARRCDCSAADIAPQTVAWTMLGVALSAYEHWLAERSVSLPGAIGEAFDVIFSGLDALESGRKRNPANPHRSSPADGDDKSVSAEGSRADAPRALLTLYDEALPVVYGYFIRRCGDRGTAEDLTSETFLAAMDAARKHDPPSMSVPWLVGVARHKLADHYRRRHDRFTTPVAEPPEPVDTTEDRNVEVLDRIVAESVLARLSDTHRTVLALRYMDDRSVPECAELIGRTVHATEALLVRARRAFKQQYPEGGTP